MDDKKEKLKQARMLQAEKMRAAKAAKKAQKEQDEQGYFTEFQLTAVAKNDDLDFLKQQVATLKEQLELDRKERAERRAQKEKAKKQLPLLAEPVQPKHEEEPKPQPQPKVEAPQPKKPANVFSLFL
jgi:hypothetical protein